MELTLKRVITAGAIIRILYGFTLGLYLFIYVLTFEDLFGSEPVGRFLLGAVFVFDFIMEAVLDPPLGAYADIKGYKPTLARSFFFRALYFGGLMATAGLIGHKVIGYPMAFLTQALFAVSYTLWSGATSAWLYDSLAQVKSEESYLKYFSRMQTGYYAGYIGGAILSAYLYFQHYPTVAYGLGVICSLIGAVFIKAYVIEPAIKKRKVQTGKPAEGFVNYLKRMIAVISDAWQYCLASKDIYYLLQLAGFFALRLHAVNYLWPPYARENFRVERLTWRWGLVVVVMTLGSLIGNSVIGARWKKAQDNATLEWRHYLFISLCFSLPVCVLSILAIVGQNSFPSFILLIALARIAVGAKDAPYEALMNRLITNVSQVSNTGRRPADVRATILSFASIFNAIIILFFFVPTTVLGMKNTVKGWLFPASLLMVATVATYRRGNGRRNPTLGTGI